MTDTQITLTGTSPTEYTAQIVKDDTTLTIINATATVVPYVPPVVVPPPVIDPPPVVVPPVPVAVAFNVTQTGNACAAWDNTTGLAKGTKGLIDWGDSKPVAIAVGGMTGRTLANGNYAVTVTHGDASKTVNITVPKGTAPVEPPPDGTPPATDPVPPVATGGVYAAALAGLTLPVKSAWSDTRPAYEAVVLLTLADGTALALDTGTQDPDYVPSAGVWIYPLLQSDGTRHPDLSLACYADCWKIGNVWLDAADNYTGHHMVRVNGETVADVDSRYDFGCYTAPCRTGLPQIAPNHEWDASLLPTYGKVDGGYGTFTAALSKADNSVNGRSLTTPYGAMGATGAQLSIGVLPGVMIPYVVDGGNENWAVVRTVEDHASCWPIHLRDRVTGLPALPSIPHCIDVTLNDTYIKGPAFTYGHVNPVRTLTASPLKPDNAHCPGFGIVASLATNSAQDLEEVIFWSAYESYFQSPVYRQYEKCISTGQIRGVAWQTRSKAYAAKLTPTDHPLYAQLQSIMDANAVSFTQLYCGPDALYGNKFGIMGGPGAFAYRYAGIGTFGMAPWQQDFNAIVVAQIIRMGFKGWDAFMAFLNTYTKARFGDGREDALWWTTAAFYSGFPRLKDHPNSSSASPGEYVADWATFNNQNLTYNYAPADTVGAVGPYADQVGKTIETADLGYGPGQPRRNNPSNVDYWANMQQALAALKDTGDGATEWARYASAILAQKSYKYGGQFNIVPRT